MADAALVTSPGLALSWPQIQDLIWMGLTDFMWRHGIVLKANFRIGTENAFMCPGCGRVLPTHVATLDHIFPQSRYGPMMNSAFGHRIIIVVVTGHNQYNLKKGRVKLGENSFEYNFGQKRYSVEGLHLIHKMDLCNLQVLDWKCNSIKNNRDWNAAFPGREFEPIVSTETFNELWAQAE